MRDFQNVDCFERMKQLSDKSIPLIVTDPPYAIGFKGQTSNTSWDDIDDRAYYDLLFRFLTEAKRILTDDGTLWMCCGRTKIPIVFRAIEDAGMKCNLSNWLTYVRAKGRGAKKQLKSQCEEVLHITKSDTFTWRNVEYLREVVVPYVKDGKPRGWFLDQNTGMRVRWSGVGNALCFTSPFYLSKFEKQIHSTQKPVLLWVELIMLSSKVGDTVFDPFAGSGSSGVACSLCGRNWIGTELDSEMHQKASEWLDHINYEEAEKCCIRHRLKYFDEEK